MHNSNLPAKPLQPGNRVQIDMNENEESSTDFMAIMARGKRLQEKMDQALDHDRAWSDIHGDHAIPKTYVPPFMQDQFSKFVDDKQRVPDLNEIEELLHI